jgi:hypothetical protein
VTRRGGNTDDVRQPVYAGIERSLIVVEADAERIAVAGGGDKEYPRLLMALNRVEQRLRKTAAAPAVVRRDDVHAAILHGFHILETTDGACRRAKAACVEKLASHHVDAPIDPHNSRFIVPDRAYCSSHVRTVPVIV